MEERKRLLIILTAIFLSVFIPPITTVPFPQEETSLVIRDVFIQTSDAYTWLSPVFHVATVALLIALYRYGQKIGRFADAFFGIMFLFNAFSNHISTTDSYGFTVITGNLVSILVVGLFWIWEVCRPRNEYIFQRLATWRYWVVPFALLAFWFPVNSDLNPGL